MKKTTYSTLSVAEAKAHLSQAIRSLEREPTLSQNRGREVAALLRIDEYRRLSEQASRRQGMAGFLRDIERLKQRFEGGVDFEPARADLAPRVPFRRHS